MLKLIAAARKNRRRYFRRIGWNRAAAAILVRLCTHKGGLPQGAPTSPRLSNLVNYRLDARFAGLAAALGGVYTRYADDITISFVEDVENLAEETPLSRHPGTGRPIPREAQGTVLELLPTMTKRIRSQGYVPRKRPTLTPSQLDGWRALRAMIAAQAADSPNSE